MFLFKKIGKFHVSFFVLSLCFQIYYYFCLFLYFDWFILCVCSDCGIFTILFADHIIHGTIDDFNGKVNIATYRDELAVCLYSHAVEKKLQGYTTNPDKPDRISKKRKK